MVATAARKAEQMDYQPETRPEGAPQAQLPSHAEWSRLVEQIQRGEPSGMEELYRVFGRGVRFYLFRNLGPQELEDKMHDTFLIVVQAIRRGELREPERLMGFIRTVVRRQVAAHIDHMVHVRRDTTAIEPTTIVPDRAGTPEDDAIGKERFELMFRILKGMKPKDREILTRFYLREESQEQICSEMDLSETQYRLLKSRAKARFGELGKRKLEARGAGQKIVRSIAALLH